MRHMLLREVYIRFLETTFAQNRVQIQLAAEKDLSIESLARAMIRGRDTDGGAGCFARWCVTRPRIPRWIGRR